MTKVTAKILEDGEILELVGEVLAIHEDDIVLKLDGGGECTIAKEDLLEPLGEVVLVLPDVVPDVKVEKKVEGKVPELKEGGKLWKVVQLMKANPNATRKQIISKIVELKIMATEAGASTYHQNAKKYL